MTELANPPAWLVNYIPDLPTSFDEEGELDLAAFARLCERQIAAEVPAIVVGETAGEAPTLSPVEHDSIVRAAVEISHGRTRVIAGTGSNSTSQAIELTRRAEAAGADAALSVVPYYNKPMQAGIYAHFCAIADRTSLPIILHDIPSRTVRQLGDDTLVRLAKSEQFIGLRGRQRRYRAPDAAAAASAAGFPAVVRRRRNGAGFYRQWRGWLHIAGIEHRAGSVPGDLFQLDFRTTRLSPDRSKRIPRSSSSRSMRRSFASAIAATMLPK